MTPICACKRPDVRTHEGGSLYCKTCGFWYQPDYGSKPKTEELRHPTRSPMLLNLLKRKVRR